MSRGAPFGFGPLPTFARQDDPGLGPDMLALLRQSRSADPGPDDVPTAVPPGFTGLAPSSTPTGAPTPVVETSGVRAIGGRAAEIGDGFADMGRRTADLYGRLRSGEIDPGAFAKAAGAHLAGQAFETIKSAVTAPHDAWTGDLQIFDPATGHVSDEAIGRAAGLAGLAMTGSLPFSAPAGALRTFGGRVAATADRAALDKAVAMQAGGASPEAIWGSTGWGLGKDGMARFEIPDDAARLRPHDGSGSTTLGQVLDHPRLFEAYPEMRDTQVFHRPELGSDAAANPAKNWIAANLDDAQALPALLHESQHIIQRREGFAPGASPIDPALAAHPQVAEVASLRQRLAGLADPQAEALASRADQAARLEAYRTAAGEVEARNVEGRQGMTAAERSATPPWRTQDIPGDRQWLPRSGGVTGDAAQLKIDPIGDPFAALEAGLADFMAHAEPDVRPISRVDPTAASWDLYHGTRAATDFDRFSTDLPKELRPHTVDGEKGAVFLSPATGEADYYAGSISAMKPGAEAGPRILRTTVDPGKTAVLDIPHLLQSDPSFVAQARQAFMDEERAGRTLTPADEARIGQMFDERHERMLGEFQDARDLNARLKELGFPETEVPQAQWGYGTTAAAIQRARDQGLDTAVLRGLSESNGGDQVVALTPGRVRSHYDPSHLLYSGGPAGAVPGLAASALAAPADAQAPSPSTASPRGSVMTSGIPFGFGFGAMPIPNANPDEAQRLLQRLPFDPSQAPNLVPTADLNGPAGALVHHPNWKTLGQQAEADGAIAMDEAGTQRMEQQAGMMPGQDAPAAPRSPMPGAADLARLFDQRPMGAAQGFAGTSGTIVPETPGPAPSQAPTPGRGMPGAPGASPPRRIFGALAVPGSDDAADIPAPGAVPASGQAPPSLPRVPGAPSNGAPGGVPLATQAFGGATHAPTAPAQAAPNGGGGATPSPAGGGFDLGGALDRFGRNGGYDTLTNLGIGLMSTRGLGPGLAVGMKLDQDAGSKRAVTDLARAEFALKSRKAQQEQAVQNMTARAIMSKMPETSAEDAVALAGNPEFVKSFMSSHYGAPEGFVRTATGLQPVAGGPQDTATLKARAQAQAEGTAAGAKDDVQLQTLPDGRVIAVNKSNLFPGQGEEAKPVVTQVAASQGVVPLTSTNDRLAAGIRQDDKRAAWRDADGKVTFEPTPPSTNINMPPTEKAEQSAIGTARAGVVKEHIEAGRAARDKIQILDQMRGALDAAGPNMMTGPLGEPVLRAKQALGGMLGTQLAGTSATEMFANSGPVLAGAAARAITARPAQIEFTTMLNAKPGLMNSPEGNRASMDVMRQSAVRDADLSDIAARSSSVDEFIRKRDEYEEAHPMINPFTGKPFGSASPASPTPLGAQGATAPTLSDLQAEARKRGLIR